MGCIIRERPWTGGAGPRRRPTEGWLKRGDGEFQTGCARKDGMGLQVDGRNWLSSARARRKAPQKRRIFRGKINLTSN